MPVLPALVPVTVCGPATEAVQVAPLQEPFGAIVKVVAEVTSPSELPYTSRPSAVYVCDVLETIVAVDGDSTRWSRAAGFTSTDAVAVTVASVVSSLAVTVCGPAVVAVQTFAEHDPSGAIANAVDAVTSPKEFPAGSNPCTVNACDPPAWIVAVAGLTAIR